MHQQRLANREEELNLFRQMLAGEVRRRIMLLQAGGGMGKTTLLAEFARCCGDDVTVVPLDLKGGPGLGEVLARLCDALGWDGVPTFSAQVAALAAQAAAPPRDGEAIVQGFHLMAVYDLLEAAFAAPPDLRRFCRQREVFRPLLSCFGAEAGLGQMIDDLIEHCETQLLLAELVEAVRAHNQAQYERFEARLKGRGADTQPASESPSGRVGRAEVEAALRSPDEGDRATRRGALARALLEDLAARPGRLVFLFDTYEHAAPEVGAWLAGPFLAGVQRLPHLLAVVGGRQVPQASIEWVTGCHQRRLGHVDDVDAWETYARRKGWNLPRPWIEGYCAAVQGHPGQIDTLLAGAALAGGGR
jgi:hypothetical protein